MVGEGHIGVDSSVVCSTVSGNAKASEGGTDDRQFPRFFLFVRSELLISLTLQMGTWGIL